MGEQTGVVLAAVVLVHAGLVLGLASLAAPSWLCAEPPPGSENGTAWATKGLWQLCLKDDCQPLNRTVQTAAFTATTALVTASSALTALGTVALWGVLAAAACRTSPGASAFTTATLLLAGICELVGVVVFSQKVKIGNENPDLPDDLPHITYAWCFKVAIATSVTLLLATLPLAKRTKLLKGRRAGYEDI